LGGSRRADRCGWPVRTVLVLKSHTATADVRLASTRADGPLRDATAAGIALKEEREWRMQITRAHNSYISWLLATRNLSPHTIRAYDGDIALFVRHIGTRTPVDRIDHELVVAFVGKLRASNLAPTSIRRRVAGLRGFCRWLVNQRLLASDPWLGVTVSVGRRRKLPRVIPSHELNRLLRHLRQSVDGDVCRSPEILARPRECTTLFAVSLMLVTGVRVGELVSVRCIDVDLPARSLRILGKGQRERMVFLANDWIAAFTKAYLAAHSTLGLAQQQLLFSEHQKPLTPDAMRSRLAQASVEAGLNIHVTPHMLRHTAATQLIEAGVDIRFIQRLLGHSSLTTTEIYTHVSDGALRQIVSDTDVLARLLPDN
jgi:site-specific recombinase XerD